MNTNANYQPNRAMLDKTGNSIAEALEKLAGTVTAGGTGTNSDSPFLVMELTPIDAWPYPLPGSSDTPEA